MQTICVRLRRGDDLLLSMQRAAKAHGVRAGVILSGVGCLTRARVRDASGVTVQEITEDCEIVSLTGTVSAVRCHVHIAVSLQNLSTLGGHLLPGSIVNTTCELVLGVLEGWSFSVEEDPETGYDEIVFKPVEE